MRRQTFHNGLVFRPRQISAGLLTTAVATAALIACLSAPLRGQEAVLTDDAQVSTATPNTPDGGAQIMRVRPGNRAFLKFSVNPALFPPGTVGIFVGKATLKVYVDTVNVSGGLQVAPALPGATPWVEGTLTNANAPTLGTAGAPTNVTNSQEWVTFDVTSLVRQWIDNPPSNNGLALLAAGATDVDIDSKEDIPFPFGGGLLLSGHPAQLEITLNHSATADAATLAANAINAANLGGVPAATYVLNTDPALTAPRPPAAGSPNYIQNTTAQQLGANFNIDGTGNLGGKLSAGLMDAGLPRTSDDVDDSDLKLNVHGNGIHTEARIQSDVGPSILSLDSTIGTNHQIYTVENGPLHNAGLFGIFDRTAGQLRFTIDPTGLVNIPGNLTVGQTLSANALSLNIVNANTGFNLGGNAFISATGTQNLFVGLGAGKTNTSDNLGNGTENTFVGNNAGAANTLGNSNTFMGSQAGSGNKTGRGNSFFGSNAGLHSDAEGNNFFGFDAGSQNTTGIHNGFLGWIAGGSNTTGSLNNFFGGLAGASNSTGTANSAFGDFAGGSYNGDQNSFFGALSGMSGAATPNTGSRNTFLGASSGIANASGSDNTLVGDAANVGANNLNFATAIGAGAVVNSSNTIVLGRSADTVQIPGSLNTNALSANILNANTEFTIGGAHLISVNQFSSTFVGAQAGVNNINTGASPGAFNTFVGSLAGAVNTTGAANSFFGDTAGLSTTTGNENSYFGSGAGSYSVTGNSNSFFGYHAGIVTTTSTDSFFGAFAGESNTTGQANSFFGFGAGDANTTGFNNSFFGNLAGVNNTTGIGDTFFGSGAGGNNTIGFGNAFFGESAGAGNTVGDENTFLGVNAGATNTTGLQNAFAGGFSGETNTTGGADSFFGYRAGLSNSSGSNNAFFGWFSGAGNQTDGNSFFGASSGYLTTSGGLNTFVGFQTGVTNRTGSSNTLLGTKTDVAVDGLTNATAIGAGAIVGQSNTVVLGNNANVGIGTSAPTSRLTVAGLMESTAGGVKFPDGTIQTTAAIGAGGPVVTSLNGLNNDVVLAAGSNITITPAGNTLTIASTGGGGGTGGGILNQTTQQTSANFNIDGTGTADIFNAATQYNQGGNRLIAESDTLDRTSNLFAGLNAGAANVFTGYSNGLAHTGFNNAYFGFDAGQNVQEGFENSFFGAQAGQGPVGLTGAGYENAIFGTYGGQYLTSGYGNSFFGFAAGMNNTSGYANVFIGYGPASDNTSGFENNFIGDSAGNLNVDGSENVFVGDSAGKYNVSGTNNTALGAKAGMPSGLSNLSFATAIGAGATVDASNKIVLGRPTDLVTVPGTFSSPSDIRLKTGVANVRYGLNELMQLRPVTWKWKADGNSRMQFGLIAQEVQPLIPELVLTGEGKDALLSMNYIGLLPIVIHAIQEQQMTIEELRKKLAAQQKCDFDIPKTTNVRLDLDSSNARNVFNGEVTTDEVGEAVVLMPDDFEIVGRKFRYQLTVIGQFAQAIIASEMKSRRFTIKTDKPNVRVSWQVSTKQEEYPAVEQALIAGAGTTLP